MRIEYLKKKCSTAKGTLVRPEAVFDKFVYVPLYNDTESEILFFHLFLYYCHNHGFQLYKIQLIRMGSFVFCQSFNW